MNSKLLMISAAELAAAIPTPRAADCLRAEMLRAAWSALKEEDLSEDMRFAICVAAGIPTETDWDTATPGKVTVTMRTAYPCAVKKVDGRFVVFTDPRPETGKA